eukprot:12739240-Alexandrium_andersonii.AAC.1
MPKLCSNSQSGNSARNESSASRAQPAPHVRRKLPMAPESLQVAVRPELCFNTRVKHTRRSLDRHTLSRAFYSCWRACAIAPCSCLTCTRVARHGS